MTDVYKNYSDLLKGTYNGSTAYTIGDIIDYNGSSYTCKQNSTGNLPTNTTYWALLAEKGDKGEQGIQGVQGIQGIQGIQGDKGEKGDKGDTGDQGIQGIQGIQGNPGTDGISFIWEGAYSAGTTYQVNDVVSYNGSTYICILATTGNAPTNATYWSLMAQKGTDGTGSGDVSASGTLTDDKIILGGGTTIVKTSGKGITTTLGTDDTTLPTSKAVKDVTDGKVTANVAITGATKTKVTYDTKGLVTSGADATTADIADSSNKRYVTDTQLTVIGNTSGTNTGDNSTNTQYSGLATSKQDTLISGTNIKTINSNSLLGSGDITITVVDSSETVKGIVEEATDSEVTAGTATGGTGAKLFVTPAKLATRLNSLIVNTISAKPLENIDGSTTPQAVYLDTNGRVRLSDADDSNRLKFIGITKGVTSTTLPDFLNGGTSASTTLLFTPNAGNKRIVIVSVVLNHTSLTPTNPTSVTYNGVNMTAINSTSTAKKAISTWYKVIGDNASPDSEATIIAVGAADYTNINVQSVCYNNINQSTPIGQKNSASGSGSPYQVSLDPTNEHCLVVNCIAWYSGTFTSWNDGQTNRVTAGSDFARIGDVLNEWGSSTTYDFTTSSSGAFSFSAFELIFDSSLISNIDIVINSYINGFTGLTIGVKYYVSNTIGSISSSAGSTSIPIGKAISATELFINN